MSEQNDRSTPPKQTPDDPNLADRRLSDEQRRNAHNQPAKPEAGKGAELPNPKDVGEAG
jgi:hypothetical protein